MQAAPETWPFARPFARALPRRLSAASLTGMDTSDIVRIIALLAVLLLVAPAGLRLLRNRPAPLQTGALWLAIWLALAVLAALAWQMWGDG